MNRYWQDLQPGEQFSTGELTLSEADILAFAAEFDPQPYHLDRSAAEESIFGGLCASGWQVSALMMRLLTDALHHQQIPVLGVAGVPSMRWKMPVFAGDTLSAEIAITACERQSRLADAGSIEVAVTVHNQQHKPVIELQARLFIAHGEAAHAN